MNTVYVLQPNGQHTGPITTEALARAIVEGSMNRDTLIAPLGAAEWLHASQLPEVLAFVDAMTTARAPSLPPAPKVVVSASPSVPPAAPRVAAPVVLPSPEPPINLAAAVAPAAAPAPKAAPAPSPAPAPAKAPTPTAQTKPADDKPKPKPWPKWLSVSIFGGFAFVALVELTVFAVTAPRADPALEGTTRGAPAK